MKTLACMFVLLLAGCSAPSPVGDEVADRPVQTAELANGPFHATLHEDAVLRLDIPGPGMLTGHIDLAEFTASRIDLTTPCGEETLGGGTGVQRVPDGPRYDFDCRVEGGLSHVYVRAEGSVDGDWAWQWTG